MSDRDAGTTSQGDGGAPPGDGEDGTQGEPFDRDRAMATIKAQRESEKTLRVQLQQAQQQIDQHKTAQMSDQDKIQQQLTTLTAERDRLRDQLQEQILESTVTQHAATLRIVDPEAAWKLLDLSKVKFDAAGKPTNVEEQLKELIGRKPWLVAPGTTDHTDGRRGERGGTSMNDLIRKQSRR